MINKITTLIGLLLILAAPISVFTEEKITWFDAMFGITAGVGLIYTKNNKLVKEIGDLTKRNKTPND